MKEYSELERRALKLKALRRLTLENSVPSKAQVGAMGKGAFLRKDLQELARHPSGLNMYSSLSTGCRLATPAEELRIKNSRMNANTTRVGR